MPPVVPAALAVVCGLLVGVTWGPPAPADGAPQRAYAVRLPASTAAPTTTATAEPPPAPTGDLPEPTAPEVAPTPEAQPATAAPAATAAASVGAGAATSSSDDAGDDAGDDGAGTDGSASASADDATTTSGDTAGSADASPVKHVFLITLADQPAALTYAPTSPATYLNQDLVPKGVLLPNHFAVTAGGLPNLMAMVSGQGPTPQAQAGCPSYTDVAPGTLGKDGQVLGDGCVMPPAGGTLADQLRANDRDWGAFVQGMATVPPGAAATCRHPAAGAPDVPATGATYATQRDPFAYFRSITDDAAGCAARDRDLSELDGVLAGPAADVPDLVYVAPGPCADGSDVPCAPGAPAGLAAADAFLRTVVPKIQASDAYADGGLIVITTDAAPGTGPGADRSACCSPAAFPNVPGQAPGGGRVGLLLLGDDLASPGTQVATATDHYDLLASLEDLFALPRLGYAARRSVKGLGLPGLLKSTEGSDGADVATTG